jgi:hypothetical protein
VRTMAEMCSQKAEYDANFARQDRKLQLSKGRLSGNPRGQMNQKIVTVIPTLKRPEMLALTLEHLSRTRQATELDCRIFLDHSNDSQLNETRLGDTEYVRDMYFPTAAIFHANNHVVAPSGSWNILHSLKSGYETGADLIFFVEEDIFVTPDFFDRHIQLQESGDYFVTSGRKLRQFDDTFFSNPGSCYRREKLALVIPHINDLYFADQKSYLENRFPNMSDAGILDDGLIRRVMRSVSGKAKCAVPPIAFHAGFHYYNRMTGYCVEGTLREKIEQLRVLLTKVNPADRYTGDFEPYLP